MKFALFIIDTVQTKDQAAIHNGAAQIIGVTNLTEACEVAKQLYENGVACIELCGAFGESGAKEIIHATKNKIPIGYITHLPEQDTIYQSAFSK